MLSTLSVSWRAAWGIVAFLGLSAVCSAQIRTGQSMAIIGGTNEVELILDDAAGTASMALKVNYDPSLLDLLSVTNKPGSLGSLFNLATNGGDGSVEIVLVRQDALVSGSGVVATLAFRINPGAKHGMTCDLPVVRRELGGSLGLSIVQGESTAASGGKIWLLSSLAADSNGDGIPDSWNIQFYGTLNGSPATADDDHDGMSNLQEYLAGTSPLDPSQLLELKDIAMSAGAGQGIVIRWISVPMKEYAVHRATNLLQGFAGLASNIVATGSENSYTDTTATANGPYFYKVKTK
ncbi:MAG: hypothetical protein C0404_09695 [Verrucomicrobia bacterium]|nr:hypothetical protein [Verrucomicrobiota bacterium]